MRVTIIDYGLGNVGSIANMVRKCGGSSEVTADAHAIARAERIILPGVGAFDTGMQNIHRSGLFDLLRQKALVDRVPFLGICLGMQLMTYGSEEGQWPGLGLVKAHCRRFSLPEGFCVPHMGWNSVATHKASRYYQMTDPETRFYFVHSYYVQCADPADVLLTCNYGGDFCAAFEHENILGVQFHPEKSHSFGKELLTGFLRN